MIASEVCYDTHLTLREFVVEHVFVGDENGRRKSLKAAKAGNIMHLRKRHTMFSHVPIIEVHPRSVPGQPPVDDRWPPGVA
jgi:hypothetical protein